MLRDEVRLPSGVTGDSLLEMSIRELGTINLLPSVDKAKIVAYDAILEVGRNLDKEVLKRVESHIRYLFNYMHQLTFDVRLACTIARNRVMNETLRRVYRRISDGATVAQAMAQEVGGEPSREYVYVGKDIIHPVTLKDLCLRFGHQRFTNIDGSEEVSFSDKSGIIFNPNGTWKFKEESK